MITNPKKALYNKVYNKTSFGIEDIGRGKRSKSTSTSTTTSSPMSPTKKKPMSAAQKKVVLWGIIGSAILLFSGIGILLLPFYLIGVVHFWNKTPEVQKKKAITQSDSLYEKGELQESIDVLLPYAEEKDYDVSTRLGYRLGQAGDYKKAEQYTQYCYDENPHEMENLYVHSITLYNLKKYKESQKVLSVLPDEAQTKPIFANIIAANYNGMGQDDIAVEIYKKCLGRKQNLEDQEIEIAVNLAKILIEKNKKADAKKYLLRVLAVSPMHEEAMELMEKTAK